MNDKLPKALVISVNVWQDSGNIRTLPEIFACYDKEKVAQIYTKAGVPETQVCDRFFRINENAVIKSIFKRKIKTSCEVKNSKGKLSDNEQKELLAQQKRYSLARKKHSWFMTLCRELVWLSGKWKTPELDEFLDDFAPEVLFVPVYPFVYMSRLQLYIIKRTKVPVVAYISDDNYTYKACGRSPLAYIHRFWLRKGVKKIIGGCKRLFVIAPKQKEEYDRLFGVDSVLLTRAVEIPENAWRQEAPRLPLKMIYTGKLGIGRDKTLAEIAKAVAKINRDEDLISLKIYSGDTPVGEALEAFKGKGVEFCGSVTADKIAELQKESDITVFAESLEKRFKNAARLSFSTKLTDYFKSGCCIFAIGDKDIAPMEYLIKEDAAITVTDYRSIEPELRKLCGNPELVSEYSKKALECGKRNHSSEKVLEEFKRVMCSVTAD